MYNMYITYLRNFFWMFLAPDSDALRSLASSIALSLASSSALLLSLAALAALFHPLKLLSSWLNRK